MAILLVAVLVFKTEPEAALEAPTPSDRIYSKKSSILGATCLAILIVYVAALQFKIPFGIATPLSIFLMGLSISKAKQTQWLILGIIGLGFSLALEMIFTQLFSVALP